jgi:MoaA/NifB/PqqE/SkfB family radical SAM enzyme
MLVLRKKEFFMLYKAASSSETFPYTRDDFNHSPLILFYEITRACNLRCRHCRAVAQPHRNPRELAPEMSKALVVDARRVPKPPLIVLTGGDPIKRPDVFDLIRFAVSQGIRTALTPAATRLITPEVVENLQQSGLHRLAISLDAADAHTHDQFRGVPGSFRRTVEIMRWARECGLPFQINTTITAANAHQIEAIHQLLADCHPVLWSVFFLVPTGRAENMPRVSALEAEDIFARLLRLTRIGPFAIKTTEAPHYRRFLLQHAARAGGAEQTHGPVGAGGAPRGGGGSRCCRGSGSAPPRSTRRFPCTRAPRS